MTKTNKHRGTNFEEIAGQIISELKGVSLTKDIGIDIGISKIKKKHKFDLGNEEKRILVECKHHEWTITGNSPSAKMTIWNEAMLYFAMTPKNFTNILFVKKSVHEKKKENLAEYYCRTYRHLITENVEIWECNVETK